MRSRLSLVAALIGVATAVVVAAVAVSSSGGDGRAAPAPAGRDVTSIVRGIPQQGRVLGRPDAPVLLVEFADPQCPYCREFAIKTWPRIVQKYVRTGKVRMELRLVGFLGADSVRASKALEAAGLQHRMWDASARFYDVQGAENSGYVTDPFLRRVLGGVHGLDVARAMADRGGPAVAAAIGAVKTMQSRYDVHATPTLMIGTDDTDLRLVADGVVSPEQLGRTLDTELLRRI
jgi:protein-disulfide isomerase